VPENGAHAEAGGIKEGKKGKRGKGKKDFGNLRNSFLFPFSLFPF
jgi:hypothetical protein